MFGQKQSGFGRGLITSPVAGRTDRIPTKVKPNSFVVPADIISGIGQGNSMAGGHLFEQLLKSAPYGAAMPKMPKGKGASKPPVMPKAGFAAGGQVEQEVPIVTAGGEFIVGPEEVAAIGGGDVDEGHARLDNLVVTLRKQIIDDLKQLPGPRND